VAERLRRAADPVARRPISQRRARAGAPVDPGPFDVSISHGNRRAAARIQICWAGFHRTKGLAQS